MNLVMIQYIEINMIGAVMLLMMLFYIIGMHHDSEKDGQKIFIRLLICNIVILLADVGIYLMRWHPSPILILANHLTCMLYFIMHSYFGYLWMRYTIQKLFPEYELGAKMKGLLLLPCVISGIFVLTSPFTQWVYYLTSANRYMRGPYLWVTTVISYLYWIISAVLAVREMIRKKRIREQTLYMTLLIFPIPTLIGNLLQFKFYGLSIVWVCSAISLLILFINLQNYQLSRDILTGLFNRRQTNKQIEWEINHLKDADGYLLVIMADVDHFKQINDLFGHVVGDQAIIAVSDALRNACREKDFIGRFGGDEFIIIGHVEKQQEASALIDRIHQVVDEFNQQGLLPCSYSLSMGYAAYSQKDELSIDSVISAADREMYKVKNSKKQ